MYTLNNQNEVFLTEEKLLSLDDYEFLEYIVNQNSQSKNRSGVQTVQELFAQRLLTLGADCEYIENKESESADLLVAKIEGSSEITLSTIGHADTVLFPTRSNYFRFEDQGRRIFGPGIADNKSGQLIAIKGIEYFLKKISNPKLNIQFISSPSEEIGSPGFHDAFKDLSENSQFVLGFEPSMEDGSIIKSRNGNKWYKLEVVGESSHSGRAHKGHMNAAHDLCAKINYLQDKCLSIDDITMNIGVLDGGHSYNSICSRATAKIDTRFTTFAGLEKIENLFEADLDFLKKPCFKTNQLTKTNISVDDFCPPLEFTNDSEAFIQKYMNIIKDIEQIEISSVHCGGAADVNHFSRKGLVSFDGLGPIAANMHRLDEYIYTSSLESRAKAFGEFLIQIDNSIDDKSTGEKNE